VKYSKSNSDDEYGASQGRRRRGERRRQERGGAFFEPWSQTQRRHSTSFGRSGYFPSRSSIPYSSVPPFAYYPQFGIPFGYPPPSYSGVLPPPPPPPHPPTTTTSSYSISQQVQQQQLQQQHPFAHYTGYSYPMSMSSAHFGSIGGTYGESNRGTMINVVGGRAKAAAAHSHIQMSNHSLLDPVIQSQLQSQSQSQTQTQTHLQPESESSSSSSLLIETKATSSPIPSLKRVFCGACGTEIKLQFCSACGHKREYN